MAEFDHDKLQRQLGILMTNSTSFMSKLYDLFVSSVPMDIEIKVWTGDEDNLKFETITIPNRAKGSIPALYGKGSPEGVVEASYGTLYIDEDYQSVYIKTTIQDTVGWVQVITSEDMDAHNLDASAHDGVLAYVHGDIANYFEVADLEDDCDYDGNYAVNKNSLFKLLGGLPNLLTEDKTDIVSAINETVLTNNFDTGCVVSGASIKVDNYPDFMTCNDATKSLILVAPFVLTSAKGVKKTIKTKIVYDLVANNLSYGTYHVFYDLDTDELVFKTGDYYMSSNRPYYMGLNDVWFNTGYAPYSMNVLSCDTVLKKVEMVEVNYAYLGKLTWGK